ncbi:MAG: 2-amino-4-hydroxy-6-hydroxymethyldihydropteridine diphosphokinase [Gammaproteobacteria bacterium]|nr:MAG: 2-amino-4-hydroxy-6-hydroxymethyldihydropteridine diphosphokinase [Pseudomonadota bacterium]PIE37921.1 MAG: 2-amino-4-hydroxy-6-hydroxymethyldihydropteridine diphosphokinase [Gammaproteobacteria bacterium]
MHTAYIGLGSNLDNPARQIERALEQLDTIELTSLTATSRFYSTHPVGPQDQPDFINAAARISTALSPARLLSELKKIELQQGRVKNRRWGERVIDLDILLYDNLELDSEELTIPHRELANRDFVLKPLLDICPSLHLPSGALLGDLLENLPKEKQTIQWLST